MSLAEAVAAPARDIDENLPVQVTVDDLVRRSLHLRRELVAEGVRVDTLGGDTTDGMRRAYEEQLNLISVPKRFGGLSDASQLFATAALIEIQTNLAAADGSLGQNWSVSQLVAREIFHANAHGQIPDATARQIADAVVHKGARLVASNSIAGVTVPMTATAVPGGIRLNGVKTFNSNSGGKGYANVGFRREGFAGRYHAIVPLDAEGVRMHHDWDNMGQRGTYSQTITYDNVFVPDGWHFNAVNLDKRLIAFVYLVHSAIMLGSALGAMDAGLEHLRNSNRTILVQFKGSAEDPLMMRRVGAFSAKLRAAHVLQQHVAQATENATPDRAVEVVIDAFRSKAVTLETSLEVTQGLFEIVGARATANKNRYDRFWRNARTFAVHDPLDATQVFIGGWDLAKIEPQILAQLRV